MGNEDAGTGQLLAYMGTKRSRGNAFDRAGLTNGVSTVLDIADSAVKTDAEFRAAYGKGKAVPFNLNEVDWDQSGVAQNREAAADGLTLNRVEDGAWDTRSPNDYYSNTTEGGNGADRTPVTGRDGGGLWKVSFEDRDRPQLGGTIELLLDGSEEPLLNQPDNMDIDGRGNILIQEDPGGNAHVARVLAYQIRTGKLVVLAEFDRAQFAPLTPGGTDAPFTIDEESSGIVDASDVLGRGWYLLDAQVHKPNPNKEYVEYGQLLAMRVRSFDAVYGG